MARIWKILAVLVVIESAIRNPQSAIAQEVEWRTDYNKARQEAVEKNRPLILDFGTEDCFFCKKLDTTTFRDPSVTAVLNKSFIPLKVDADKERPLAQALRIDHFPTLVIARPDRTVLAA